MSSVKSGLSADKSCPKEPGPRQIRQSIEGLVRSRNSFTEPKHPVFATSIERLGACANLCISSQTRAKAPKRFVRPVDSRFVIPPSESLSSHVGNPRPNWSSSSNGARPCRPEVRRRHAASYGSAVDRDTKRPVAEKLPR